MIRRIDQNPAIDLWLFHWRRMLQCSRITIHKNLIASFIIRSVLFVIYFEPFVTDRQHSYRDIVRIAYKAISRKL